MELREIIYKPFMMEVLKECQEGTNITKISNKYKISYKTAFLKVKELRETQLIKSEDNILTIVPEYKEIISKYLDSYFKDIDKLMNLIKGSKGEKEFIEDILRNVKENRSIDFREWLEFLMLKNKNKKFSCIEIKRLLLYCGFIKERVEITKTGTRLLNLIKKSPSIIKSTKEGTNL